jgi:hypothetical protein
MLNNRLPLLPLPISSDHLTLRKPEVRNAEVNDKLAELRNQIDKIDDLVIQKIAERMQIVEKLVTTKKITTLPFYRLAVGTRSCKNAPTMLKR